MRSETWGSIYKVGCTTRFYILSSVQPFSPYTCHSVFNFISNTSCSLLTRIMSTLVSAAGVSQVFEEAEEVSAPIGPLCESCCKINIERLSEDAGYTHSWLEVLEKTTKWCGLCHSLSCVLSTRANKWERYKITPRRYKMTLSVDSDVKYRKVRPDHCHYAEFNFRCIVVEVFDIRPWEPSDDGAHPTTLRTSRKQWEYVKRQKQEVIALKTWTLCHTQQGDPAMAFGLPWLRNVEYTGSTGAMEVARGWCNNALQLTIKVSPHVSLTGMLLRWTMSTTSTILDPQQHSQPNGPHDSLKSCLLLTTRINHIGTQSGSLRQMNFKLGMTMRH